MTALFFIPSFAIFCAPVNLLPQVLQYKHKCSELEAEAELQNSAPTPPPKVIVERPVSRVRAYTPQNPVHSLGLLEMLNRKDFRFILHGYLFDCFSLSCRILHSLNTLCTTYSAARKLTIYLNVWGLLSIVSTNMVHHIEFIFRNMKSLFFNMYMLLTNHLLLCINHSHIALLYSIVLKYWDT